jgi:hypothetical protein
MAGKKGVLRIAIEDFLQTFGFSKWIFDGLEKITVWIEDAMFDEYKTLLDMARQVPMLGKYVPSKDNRGNTPTFAWAPILIAGVAAVIGGLMIGMAQPFIKLGTYLSSRLAKEARISPETAALFNVAHDLDAPWIEDDLKDQGYDERRLSVLYFLSKRFLSVDQAIQAWRRKLITDGELENYLRYNRIDPNDREKIKALSEVIPGISDILRMIVRDAWNEEVVHRFGYDEAFPQEAVEWAEKQGLSAEWVKRYWRAHWELPGPTLAFEMVHRLRPGRSRHPFTLDDLRTLLRTADYPEYFRERMIEVSYNPVTRVDLRRLYRLGVIDYKELIERYKDLGYTDRDAELLAQFTAKYEADSSDDKDVQMRNLSLSLIKQLYMKSVINEGEAKKRIQALNYSDEDADRLVNLYKQEKAADQVLSYDKEAKADIKRYVEEGYALGYMTFQEAKRRLVGIGYIDSHAEAILNLVDYHTEMQILEEQIKRIAEEFNSGVIDDVELTNRLGKLNIPAERMSRVLDLVMAQKRHRTRRLTTAQYVNAYFKQVIDKQTLLKCLGDLGYNDVDIQILLKLEGAIPEEEA